ncbi:hypothetical protein B5X24_HaOG216468 [Helicoverpa armigera]|nr:hypothetical protein B5X24_HaOG216468 [Helicoverpa armigera]
MHENRIERSASKRWRGSVRRLVAAAVYNLSCFTHGCSTGWVSGVLGSEALAGGAWLAALPCLDAAKVMCWFEGSDFREDLTDVIEQQEVKIRTSEWCGRRELRRRESDTFTPMLARAPPAQRQERSACKQLFGSRRSRRALASCAVVLSAAAGSGAGAVSSFAAAVLRHSAHPVPTLNLTAYNYTMYNGTAPRSLFEPSEAGSILCGAALVLGAAVATVSVDKLGRKMLLLWSCSGITCCLAILGAYCDPNLRLHSWYSHRLWPYKRTHNLKEKDLQLTDNFTDNVHPQWKNYTTDVTRYRVAVENDTVPGEFSVHNVSDASDVSDVSDASGGKLWTPVALMSLVLFLYNIGLGSVPYVLISELFAINVRSLASSLLISWTWLSSFLLLRYYGSLAVLVGLHGTYYICASVTLLGALYIFFIIPETKGKAQEQIDEDLDGPLLVLRRRRKDRDQR